MARAVAILFAVVSVVLFVCGIHTPRGDSFIEPNMMLYQFSHVNIWHMLANLTCLYSISSSRFRVTWRTWLTAYAISAIIPCAQPTEGMSGLLYAVLGIISWQSANTNKYHLWCAFFIGICFLFPNAISGWLHVWCYIGGVLIGLVGIIDRIGLKFRG